MVIADMKGLKQGALRLAVITTAKYFIPRLLGSFCRRYPGIDVSMQVSNRERIIERLLNNEDDLYILGQPPEEIDAIAEPFLLNPLIVLAIGDLHRHVDAGIAPAETAEQARNEILGGGDHREPQRALFEAFHVGDDHLEAREPLEDVAREALQCTAGIGEIDLFANLLKQREADGRSQFFDLHRHRRLGEVQLLRGTGEAAEPGNGLEYF